MKALRIASVLALVALGLIVWPLFDPRPVPVIRILRRHPDEPKLTHPAVTLASLLVLQITLGGATVLMQLAVVPATAHVVTGALVLATAWLITLRVFRLLSRPRLVHAAQEAETTAAEAPAGWAVR